MNELRESEWNEINVGLRLGECEIAGPTYVGQGFFYEADPAGIMLSGSYKSVLWSLGTSSSH